MRTRGPDDGSIQRSSKQLVSYNVAYRISGVNSGHSVADSRKTNAIAITSLSISKSQALGDGQGGQYTPDTPWPDAGQCLIKDYQTLLKLTRINVRIAPAKTYETKSAEYAMTSQDVGESAFEQQSQRDG